MKIYIASSWKNKHGVEMLTALLRVKGHEVISWIENCNKEGLKGFNFEEWVHTQEAEKSFKFDTTGATTCDIFIYYGNAGKDAAFEMGAAWAKSIPILALWSKGEDFGLMRKAVKEWCFDFQTLINKVQILSLEIAGVPTASAQLQVIHDHERDVKMRTGLFTGTRGKGLKALLKDADLINAKADLEKHLQKETNPYACYGDKRPCIMDFENTEEYEERIKNYNLWEEKNNYMGRN